MASARPTPALSRVPALTVGWILWASFAATAALPHGGVYRGPGSTVPPGSAPGGSSPAAPSSGPGTPGSAGADPDSWATWWAYRRDPFLELKAAVHRDDGGGAAAPTTGSDGFDLGRGERTDRQGVLRPDEFTVRTRVVPALREALRDDAGVDLRSACLLALAKIGVDPQGETLVAVLESHLDDPVQEVAESAALALGLCGRERALFLLADLLDDAQSAHGRIGGKSVPQRTRAFAAYALGLGALRSTREDVRRFAISRLAAALERERFASRDVPVAIVHALGLAPLALEPQPDTSAALSPSASRRGQVRHLLALLADERGDAAVQAHVPGGLGALLEDIEREPGGRALKEEAARALLLRLHGERARNVDLRQGAIVGLQALGDGDGDELDREIARALERAAAELEPLSRGLAQIALGDSSARAGAGPDPERGLREARAFLMQRLAQGTTLSRPWAAFGLALGERRRQRAGWLPTPEVGAALRGALVAARSPEERAALALALGLIEDDQAPAPVRALFHEARADDLRGTFAVALGLLRDAASVPALTQTVRESRFRAGLLRDAAVGLALAGDKRAVPLLAEELASASSLASQAALCAALGTVGDARAVERLIAFLADPAPTQRARAFAAAALGNVADPSPLPFHAPIARRVLWRNAPETLIDPAGGRGLLDLY
jgi:HEAT repeat protein